MPPQSHGVSDNGFYVSNVSFRNRFGSTPIPQPAKPPPPTKIFPHFKQPPSLFAHSFVCNPPATVPTTIPSPPDHSNLISHATQPIHNTISHELTVRRPKPGCSITPSELCPTVRAKDRLQAWTTPYARLKRSEHLLSLPPEVIEWGEKLTLAGLADSTKESYGAGLLRFNQFCDMLNISEHQRMPASDHLIVGFLGYHMGKISGSCAKSWLSALQAWHKLKGAPWDAESRLIHFARAGA